MLRMLRLLPFRRRWFSTGATWTVGAPFDLAMK